MKPQSVINRQKIERRIVRTFVKAALADGCDISVYDGEAFCLKRSTSEKDIMAAIMSTDEDYLVVGKFGKKHGSVQLVYGNDGYDVISDYSISLEYLMPVVRAAEEKAEREVA